MANITSITKGSANHKTGDIIVNGTTFTATSDQVQLLIQYLQQHLITMVV